MQDKEVLDYIKQAFELKAQGCFKQAIEMLYKTLETESSNTEILYQLGDLYFQLQNYNRSEGYLEKVLAINPSHIKILQSLSAFLDYAQSTTRLKSMQRLRLQMIMCFMNLQIFIIKKKIWTELKRF